jgi:hypothetical protein
MSPGVKPCWNDNLEKLFPQPKVDVVEASKEKVKRLDPGHRTALSLGWSKTSIEYLIYQEYCKCTTTVTTLCLGSRHPRDAERVCQPTKGEALTMAQVLEDTRPLALGCRDPQVEDRYQTRDQTAGDHMKTT